MRIIHYYSKLFTGVLILSRGCTREPEREIVRFTPGVHKEDAVQPGRELGDELRSELHVERVEIPGVRVDLVFIGPVDP